ncbi:MAG: DUF4381 domain-containing protein [Candidatus Thioglobus sp.]|nr:MAG: DUF4381 domain-containing protein [Candidatus Thioglobus sp.]
MNKTYDIKDIKPIVDIADNSLYWLLAVIFSAFLLILGGYYFWKIYQSKRQYNEKKAAIEALKNLDFNDSKSTAYAFGRYAPALVNEENTMVFEQINNALMAYKYKKQVGKLDAILIEKIKGFTDD